MGEKQAGNGQHLFFFLTGFVSILIAISGCVEKDRGYLAKKRIESVLETEGERSLDFARNLLAEGLYEESLARSESVLKLYPRSLGDQALLNMGLVHADPAYANADIKKSIEYFQRLIKEYPESILKVEAEIWILVLKDRILKKHQISELKDKLEALKQDDKAKTEQFKNMQLRLRELQGQVRGLKSQIDQLKNVDIRIEEKRRKNGSQ